MSNLIQLVYMSAAARPLESDELTELLAKARRNNAALGITGMLVYHEGSFLQVLEGPPSTVEPLYEKIKQDGRHTRCTVLLKLTVRVRSFDQWSMGFMNTAQYGPQRLPGFDDFFGKRFTPEAFSAAPSAARTLLLAFREGSWRQSVDTETPMAAAR